MSLETRRLIGLLLALTLLPISLGYLTTCVTAALDWQITPANTGLSATWTLGLFWCCAGVLGWMLCRGVLSVVRSVRSL